MAPIMEVVGWKDRIRYGRLGVFLRSIVAQGVFDIDIRPPVKIHLAFAWSHLADPGVGQSNRLLDATTIYNWLS